MDAPLDQHRRLLADASRDLRTLQAAAGRLALDEVGARLQELLGRVEDEVFRVAVVGEFKRGKSTLINAMLGEALLPADVLPCSATLNRVTYGLSPAVRLVFRPDAEGRRREEQIPPEALVDYVTRLSPESERRAADIEEAILYHPLRFCRDKADIIDTPGLNDDEAMTRVTLEVLPRVDAAIFVILAQSPFSGYEADFLSRLLTSDLGRVLFVVNRMDEIRREPDRARILQVVRERIARAVRVRAEELHGAGSPEAEALIARIGEPKVFGVSAVSALEARIDGDDAALARSGFPDFEAALEAFLFRERGVVTLLLVAEAAGQAARRVQQQAALRRGALGMQAADFEAACAHTAAELEGLQARLAVELGRIQEAGDRLRASLRPRARQLPELLLAEADRAIDDYPLDADAIHRDKVASTCEAMSRAVRDRVQATARREGEKVQIEIERGLQAELARLVDFGAQLEAALATIELRFTTTPAPEGLGPGVAAGAGAVSGALGGWLFGGVVGGAFTGWQVAGARGAAVGAAAGAAVGFGTVMLSGLLIGALSLPLTWPVMIPTLALAGLASSLGARWFTRLLFSDEQLARFREAFRAELLRQLEAGSARQVAQIEAVTDHQVEQAFAALRARVEAELGGAIAATERSLAELRVQRARSAAAREHEGGELDGLSAQAAAIEARMRSLTEALRDAGRQP